ncbi:MAG: hypothetical protein ACKV2T_14580 [Kofleriaceae bacterium]
MSPKKTKSNPLGAGRNPRAGEPAKPFTFNLTTSERTRYQAAADADSKTLGEWIRAACEAQLSRASRRRA